MDIFTLILLVVAGYALLLCCIRGIGFGHAGVVAESIAARLQALIGNVAARSVFAIAQSIGATGNLQRVVILLVVLVVAYVIVYRWFW